MSTDSKTTFLVIKKVSKPQQEWLDISTLYTMMVKMKICLKFNPPPPKGWMHLLEDKFIPQLPNIPCGTSKNLQKARPRECFFSCFYSVQNGVGGIPMQPHSTPAA